MIKRMVNGDLGIIMDRDIINEIIKKVLNMESGYGGMIMAKKNILANI